jgi:hypothetical protein
LLDKKGKIVGEVNEKFAIKMEEREKKRKFKIEEKLTKKLRFPASLNKHHDEMDAPLAKKIKDKHILNQSAGPTSNTIPESMDKTSEIKEKSKKKKSSKKRKSDEEA